MSSNLPPGVTGNEYEIAGPDFERDEYRECPMEGTTVRTISGYGMNRLDEAIAMLSAGGANLVVVLAHLRSARADIDTIDIDGECPFGGDVTVAGYGGVVSWECPACRTIHEDEMERD